MQSQIIAALQNIELKKIELKKKNRKIELKKLKSNSKDSSQVQLQTLKLGRKDEINCLLADKCNFVPCSVELNIIVFTFFD